MSLENLSEIVNASVKQRIAVQAMMAVGCVNWIDYGDNRTLIVNWDDGEYGIPSNYIIDYKGIVTKE